MTDATVRIDAHHHFWDPARYSYPWMAGDAMAPVRRAFTPDDLRGTLGEERIDGTVLVQTLSSAQETREFLDLAAATGFVHGVVGWVDLTSPSVADDLDALLDGPACRWLVGIRHQVHDEPDPDWLRAPTCAAAWPPCRPAASPTTCWSARGSCPPPSIRSGRSLACGSCSITSPSRASPTAATIRGASGMPALAAQPNVAVKLSGMVTEADWATWTPRDLRPFVGDVAEWFGVGRLMFGSDWPVCLLAGSYHAVLGGLIDALPALSPAELDQVLGMNALRIYQLDRSSAAAPRRL